MRFSKFAQNSPENDIHAKQESIPPGRERPFSVILHAKNGTSDAQIRKRRPVFVASFPKNGGIDSCFTWISFSGEFWASFENRVFRALFWPISHCKIPKSKTYGAIAQIKSLKSSNGCFGLLIHKGTGCKVGRAQKIFLVFQDTLLASLQWDLVSCNLWVWQNTCVIKSVRALLIHPGLNVRQQRRQHMNERAQKSVTKLKEQVTKTNTEC